MLPRGASNARQQMFDRARQPPRLGRDRRTPGVAQRQVQPRIGKRGGTWGGTTWHDAATRVGGAIFPHAPSRILAWFFIIFPPYTFSKERSDFEELCCGGGEDLDPLCSGALLDGRKRSDRRAADSLRRDALTSGAKASTPLSVSRRALFCSFIRRLRCL